MEAQNIAQRYSIFFCIKLGDSATTIYGKLQQAFGDDAVSRAQVFRWHKMFSEGRTIVEDEQRSRRPMQRSVWRSFDIQRHYGDAAVSLLT